MIYLDSTFWKNRAVLVTGHTGFKGSWMCTVLNMLGANVTGYALEPDAKSVPLPLFEESGASNKVNSVFGDVRDFNHLKCVFDEVCPEIVIHMAAQPLVRESYRNPLITFETNIMGTANVLECIRNCKKVKSFVNVTTDKVYFNKESKEGYREENTLCGSDPYSNSKSCSELISYSYNKSFFENREIAVSTVRAGNVIGGGDFSVDRIIPDCIRAVVNGDRLFLRNPNSVRPYQHVLEPVVAYLLIAQEQYKEMKIAGSYNVGPNDSGCLTTGELATLFCRSIKRRCGTNLVWNTKYDEGPDETTYLKLNCKKIERTFGWTPVWDIEEAVERVTEWLECYLKGMNIEECMDKQVRDYLGIEL